MWGHINSSKTEYIVVGNKQKNLIFYNIKINCRDLDTEWTRPVWVNIYILLKTKNHT